MFETKIVGAEYQLYVGQYRLVTFSVADRFKFNGNKQPRNLAVRIEVNSVFEYHPALGGSVTVVKAIEICNKLEMNVDIFVELLKDHGWGGELPPEYSGQQVFF